jgi:medium-chain acyl-[acyl-carrier-protein] hydrolase
MAPMNPWLTGQPTARLARLNLICFSYSGGGGSVFRNWAEELGSEIGVLRVQLPGRETRFREAPFVSIEDLVPPLTDGVMQVIHKAAGRPFAFYGHSLGSKIGFEVARELRRRGTAQPCHFFAGACQAPQLPWTESRMHDLGETEFIEEIQRRYGGVPRQVLEDSELRALLIPTLRADIRLMETYAYRPEPPLTCGITAFGGTADNAVSPSALEAWKDQTSGSFQMHMIAGDHFFLNSARIQLLQLISAKLAESPGAQGAHLANTYVEDPGV